MKRLNEKNKKPPILMTMKVLTDQYNLCIMTLPKPNLSVKNKTTNTISLTKDQRDDLNREFSKKYRKFKHGPDPSAVQIAKITSGPHLFSNNTYISVKSVIKWWTM